MLILKKHYKSILIHLVLFAVLFFSFKTVADKTYNGYTPCDYHNALHADPGGYYVYLPATFKYSFTGKGFPAKQDSISGYGYYLENNKVITKYTYGVSFFEMPFYLVGQAYANLTGTENTGFSPINMKFMDWSGITYGILGLFMLFYALKRFVRSRVAYLSILIMILGTNVIYYFTFAPAYSHIYSFFLFSAFLLLAIKLHEQYKLHLFILLCAVVSFIVLIRPIDVFLFPLFFFLNPDTTSTTTWRDTIKKWFTIKHIIIFALLGFIIFLPQFLYWKFAYNSYVSYSYANEGFPYLLKPKVAEFLFAPLNGMLLYAPLYAIFILSIMFMPKVYRGFKIYLLLLVGIIIYLSSSWHAYHFGCGFSSRNFVEYAPLLCISFACMLQTAFKKLITALLLITISCSGIFVVYRLMTNFDVCFFGNDDWDWKEYNYLLKSKDVSVLQNYDEVGDTTYVHQTIADPFNTTNKCIAVTKEKEFVVFYTKKAGDISSFIPRKMKLNFEARSTEPSSTFDFAIQVMRGPEQVYYQSGRETCTKTNWKELGLWAQFPPNINKDDVVNIFVWNTQKTSLLIDNCNIEIR